ncbi:MAG: alkaline phosphatase [Lentisphaeria bacterium]|jgi:alkaline phosphatase
MIPVRHAISFSLLLLFAAWAGTLAAAAAEDGPRNVILFIGDGMGLAQVQAAAVARARAAGASDPAIAGRLAFEEFPVFGYLTTAAANSFVTDSAAAGTALAGGEKTDNGVIGQTPAGRAIPSIARAAKAHGRAVGILSSVGFDHATPACFYAHDGARGNYEAIVNQALGSGFDLIFGGGVCAQGWDDARLAAAARAAGWQFVNPATLAALTPATAGERLLGSFDLNGNDQLDYAVERQPGNREPRLADLTRKALEILAARIPRQGGFFLMAEGGAIDWACHNNAAAAAVGEVLELDQAVRETLAFLAANGLLDDTLVVVTADHETGGLALIGPAGKPLAADCAPEFAWTSGGHTGIPVPVYARGPGAAAFAGKHDNTHVGRTLRRHLEAPPPPKE